MSKVGQSRRMSLIETWANIAIGFSINFTANLIILPLFGFNITLGDNLIIGVLYTVIAVVRGYGVRRMFNWIYTREK
jgi:hypothetical protein